MTGRYGPEPVRHFLRQLAGDSEQRRRRERIKRELLLILLKDEMVRPLVEKPVRA